MRPVPRASLLGRRSALALPALLMVVFLLDPTAGGGGGGGGGGYYGGAGGPQNGGGSSGFGPSGTAFQSGVRVGDGLARVTFLLQASTTVTSITPNYGPATGGTEVEIEGTGFSTDEGATRFGIPGSIEGFTSVNCTSETRCTAVSLPFPCSNCIRHISIFAIVDGRQSLDSRSFGWYARPLIQTIAPSSGPAHGGTRVTLHALRVLPPNGTSPVSIHVGTQPATNVSCVRVPGFEADVCTAETPHGTAGPVPVTITGFSGTSDPITYTYVVPPVATNDTATTAQGTAADIDVLANDSGDGIHVTAVGQPTSGTAEINGEGGITYTPNPGFVGTDSFPYTITDVVDQTASATVTVEVGAAPPRVISVAPAEGPTEGGARITVTGSGFQPGATVTIDDLPATTVAVRSAATIEATTPPHAMGAVTVGVHNPDGQGASLPNGFTYVELPPTVTSVSPNHGPEARGTVVTITGSGFRPGTGATIVTFGGAPATGVVCPSTTQCQAVSPPGRGAVSVQVTVAGRTSADTPADDYSYEPPPRLMTLAVQVWRQIPPLVSENQIEPTIVPVVGEVVEALIDGVLCGQGVTDSQGRAQLVVAADPPAAGCGRDGRALRFRVNGAAAFSDPLRFQSGGQASVTLTLPGPMPPPRR